MRADDTRGYAVVELGTTTVLLLAQAHQKKVRHGIELGCR
jgi:hypothetical protein